MNVDLTLSRVDAGLTVEAYRTRAKFCFAKSEVSTVATFADGWRNEGLRCMKLAEYVEMVLSGSTDSARP